jgi:hypothetical protein
MPYRLVDAFCEQIESLSCTNAGIEYAEGVGAMDETPQAATFLDRERKITELQPTCISHDGVLN